MATIADLNVRLGADATNLMATLDKAARKFRKTSREMAELAENMFTAVSLPVIGVGAAAISSAADIEKLTNAMTSTMGSAEAAAKEIELLREAAKLPGLDFEQAIKGSVRLQAVGLSAETSRRAMAAFGNAMALAGGSAEQLDGVTLALTQIAAKGKISAEEILQLGERIPQISKLMISAFGTASTEQLQKMGVSAEEFITKIITAAEKLPQATVGLSESLADFNTNIKISLATLGQTISKSIDLQGKLTMVADALESVTEWFKELNPSTQKYIVYTGLALAAVAPFAKAIAALSSLGGFLIGTLSNIVGAFKILAKYTLEGTIAFKAMDTAMRLTVIGVVATAITGLVLAFQHFNSTLSQSEKATRALTAVQTQAKQSIVDEEMKIDSLIATIKDENTARADKQKAIEELQKISPQIFGNLTLERDLTRQLTDGKKKYIETLMLQAEADALYNSIVERKQKIISMDINSDEAKMSTMDKLISFLTYGGDETKRLAYEQALATQRTNEAKDAIQGEIDVLKERSEVVRQQLAGLNAPAVATGGGGGTGGGGEDADEKKKKKLKGVNDVLLELDKNYAQVATKSAVFGSYFDANAERASLLEKAITDLIEMGLSPGDAHILRLSERFKTLNDDVAKLPANFKLVLPPLLETAAAGEEAFVSIGEKFANFIAMFKPELLEDFMEAWGTLKGEVEDFGDVMENAAIAAQDAVFNMVHEGKDNLKDFAKEASKAAAKVVRSYIMQGVAAVVKDALEKFGVLGIAIGAAAGAGAGVLFNTVLGKLKIPAFAQGGLVYGPQLAMVGDNPGAATDPEVIAPLSKLQGMMGRTQQITGTVRVSGSDLLIMLENAERNQRRYGT